MSYPELTDKKIRHLLRLIVLAVCDPAEEAKGNHLSETKAVEIIIDRMLKAEAELKELQQTFDLRWDSDMRAIKRWQAAHPGNDLVWPDHADLSIWLMEQLTTKEKEAPNATSNE